MIAVGGCGSAQREQNLSQSRTRLDLAKDYLSKGELERAEVEAQKALSLSTSNEEAHFVLGLIDLMKAHASHRTIEIVDCLDGIDAEVQDNNMVQSLRAAEEHFGNAVELAPDYGEAWANRGIAATQLNDYERAIAHFERALENNERLENAAFARVSLGWAYFLRDDMLAATRELLQASQMQPGMCLSTYRLGRVYFARKEWEKALQKFQEVVDQTQCPIQDAHLYLMKTYVELGSTDVLDEIGRACVELAPRSCIALQCQALAGTSELPPSPPAETLNQDQVP
ncbi:tetratricopeptide repeat protein [Haliangium ochraceum]|uniref:TPR repeat-containing protein n=1 Tax=Haliangium ochraceum (strain DSM 14365 / JCM 11303 / SMP-2) TaxID=502025 RepID=D0LWC7_HALO1|nr:tetratricopeptide repeat protein [Haliangium ochraceum]ACY16059.1 TPR repeat-containing protein [Haliangium ochraceum DSM 14365]